MIELVPIRRIQHILEEKHYLGVTRRGFALQDENGVVVLAAPTSRRLPMHWLELTRWCLYGEKNGGSKQWAKVSRWIRRNIPTVSTVVSYSDPSVGHTGALYRACNWLWAPTWHRLRPPPTKNGRWNTNVVEQEVKDRWVFILKEDRKREEVLVMKDDAVLKKLPWARYTEPHGADYKKFKEMS